MKTTQIRILQAEEGKYLYNGDTICRVVQLAPSANENDWSEITEEEKLQIEKEQEERINQNEILS